MADTTFYERGNAYHDSAGNPAIIKNGNELTFTEHFNAGGGGELPVASASTLGGVKVGDGLNVTAGGVLSVAPYTPPAYSTVEVNTGEKWIDGKDIYRKVITLESAVIVSSTSYKLSSDINYEILIGVKLINGASVTSGYAFVQSDGLYVSNTSQWTTSIIIIEYTKPTPAEQTNTRTVKKSVKKRII